MLSISRRHDGGPMALEHDSAPPAGYLAPDIYDSWMRCISLGLDTRRPPPPEIVSEPVLRKEQQRHGCRK